MMDIVQPSIDTLERAVDAFWETFPPFWQNVRAHIRKVAVEQFDITVEQFHILRHIRRGRGSISELADAKRISRAAISQAVDVLVNKGMITRTQARPDRRYVLLELTSAGNALLDAIFDNTRQWTMGILTPLSEDELQNLIRSMETLQKSSSL